MFLRNDFTVTPFLYGAQDLCFYTDFINVREEGLDSSFALVYLFE